MAKKGESAKLLRVALPLILGFIALVVTGYVLLHDKTIAVLQPQGVIASQEKDLMIFTILLGLIVIIPVFILLFTFAWKYRAGNKKAKYTPNVAGNRLMEAIWWGVPIIIIGILSIVTWRSTHQLDPYRDLVSSNKPIYIKVVALEWKWLFIYPEQQIATVGEVRFPEKTPVVFELTADAPMSTFWIPSLGSQIYTMSGMSTQLRLMADSTGEYRGLNTNINGSGYASMTFNAISMEKNNFDTWADQITDKSANHKNLDWEEYQKISQPSKGFPVTHYHLHELDLYDKIMMKYGGHWMHSINDDMKEVEYMHGGDTH